MNFDALMTRKFGDGWKSHTGKHGQEYRVNCIFCPSRRGGQDRKKKLYINPRINRYNCFRCEARGTVDKLIPLFDRADLGPVKFVQRDPPPDPGKLYPIDRVPEDNLPRQYLESRGYDVQKLWDMWGVMACLEGPNFVGGLYQCTNTVVTPIYRGRVYKGWQSRLIYNPDDLTDEECQMFDWPKDDDGDWIRPPKYFTSPGMEKRHLLYGFDTAIESDTVVVTEGVYDAISVGLGAVATLGKGITNEQMEQLARHWKQVIVLLDPGSADDAVAKIRARLVPIVATAVVTLQGYSDPGSAPWVGMWQQIIQQGTSQRLELDVSRLHPRWSTSNPKVA